MADSSFPGMSGLVGNPANPFGGLSPDQLAALFQTLQQGAPEATTQDRPALLPPSVPMAPQHAAPTSAPPSFTNAPPMGLGSLMQPQADPATTGAVPPAVDPQAPTASMVPLPPGRPSDADLMMPAPAPHVDGMNPGRSGRSPMPGMPGVPAQPSVTPASTGNPEATNVAPANAFDPLTGQAVSGSPKLMQAPGQGGPVDGGGRVAAQAGVPAAAGSDGSNFLQKFAQGLNNPAIGDLLLNVGIGLMSNRGFGPGIAAGLQGYQANQGNQTKQLLQQYQLQQQIQGQNATRKYLAGKGLSPDQVEAATLNPAILSSVQQQMNKDPQTFNIGGHTYLGRPDQPQDTWKDLGETAGPPSGFRPGQNGALAPIAGGPQSVEYKKAVADATAPEKFLQVEQADGSKRPMLVTQNEQGETILVKPKGLQEEASGKNPFATPGKQNNDQTKASGYADRMFGAEPILRKYETLNNENAFGTIGATIAEHAPNSAKSTERQQMEQAQRNFINAQLRRESGAAISEGEFANARQQYFPQPGDKPEVIAQKRINRQEVISGMARDGGQSYQPPAVFGPSGEIVPFGQRSQQAAEAAPQPRQQSASSQTPFSREDMLAEAKRRGLIK
jgi:hypothetical protein